VADSLKPVPEAPPKHERIENIHLLSSLCALSCLIIDGITFPIESLKNKIQNYRQEFLTLRSGFKKFYQQEGIKTFYKGWTTIIPCSFFSNYVWFVTYEYCNKYQLTILDTFDFSPGTEDIIKNFFPFLSGSLAELSGMMLYLPFDLIRIRMQVGEYNYAGMADAIGKIYKKEGLKRFFQASHLMLTTSVLYSGFQFTIYEYLRSKMLKFKKQDSLKVLDTIAVTFMTSATCSVVINPFELIMTRYQMVDTSKEKVRVFKIIRELVKNEGIGGIYKGFTSRLLMCLSYSAFYLPIYEFFRVKYGVILH